MYDVDIMTKLKKPIPKFDSEDEEREFWATHDSTDYIDIRNAKRVEMPNLKRSRFSHPGVTHNGRSVMTIKPDTITNTATELRKFPVFPPREDMQNPIYLYRPSHMTALAVYLAEEETTLVLGEVPVSPTLSYRAKVRIPDLTVSYNCNPAQVVEQRGYAIDEQGKPPDFVLEVASVSTGRVDYTDKRVDYESFGIAEYWRFDPTGGDYYDAALAGDRLVDGRYVPIEIEWLDDDRCRGYSESLGLYVCWEYGGMRWYDPDTGSYLRTHEEEIMRAEEAAELVGLAEERAWRAEERADEAAARANEVAERAVARADEAIARADDATARAERAEAELRRLRQRLDAPDTGD